MKDVKFRGKLINDRSWTFGYYVNTHNKPRIVSEQGNGILTLEYFVHEESVGQTTGIKDSSGNEIYVGDILKVEILDCYEGDVVPFNWHFIDSNELYEVIICGGMFKLRPLKEKSDYPFLFNSWALKLEIVGNTTDNPELLK